MGEPLREGGLEPPRLATPDPKSGASANSATLADAVVAATSEPCAVDRCHSAPQNRSLIASSSVTQSNLTRKPRLSAYHAMGRVIRLTAFRMFSAKAGADPGDFLALTVDSWEEPANSVAILQAAGRRSQAHAFASFIRGVAILQGTARIAPLDAAGPSAASRPVGCSVTQRGWNWCCQCSRAETRAIFNRGVHHHVFACGKGATTTRVALIRSGGSRIGRPLPTRGPARKRGGSVKSANSSEGVSSGEGASTALPDGSAAAACSPGEIQR